MRSQILLSLCAVSFCCSQPAQAVPQKNFVILVVKACPAVEQTGKEHKPAAVTGDYADPINQGATYDNAHSLTKTEREEMFAALHCIDVPIPPEVTTGGEISTEMTMAQCAGHRGYLTAMQFLQTNPAYKDTFPAVGAWHCLQQPFPAAGLAGM